MFTLTAAQTFGATASATGVTCTVFGDQITTSGDGFQVLYQGNLPTSTASLPLYTVPGSDQTIINEIDFVNTTSAAITITVYINGTAATNQVGNAYIPALGMAIYEATTGWTIYDARAVEQQLPLYINAGQAYGPTSGSPSSLVTATTPAFVVTSLTVCNIGTITDTFYVQHALAGAASANAQYVYYKIPVLSQDTFLRDTPIWLANTDVLRVWSDQGTCAFNAYGAPQ